MLSPFQMNCHRSFVSIAYLIYFEHRISLSNLVLVNLLILFLFIKFYDISQTYSFNGNKTRATLDSGVFIYDIICFKEMFCVLLFLTRIVFLEILRTQRLTISETFSFRPIYYQKNRIIVLIVHHKKDNHDVGSFDVIPLSNQLQKHKLAKFILFNIPCILVTWVSPLLLCAQLPATNKELYNYLSLSFLTCCLTSPPSLDILLFVFHFFFFLSVLISFADAFPLFLICCIPSFLF